MKLSVESPLSIRRWTWWDDRHDRRTYGQLSCPGEERFPVLADPLPVPAVYRIGPCPALIHPGTGVIFGLRLGTSLPLLRLPEQPRLQAISIDAVWARSPLPAQRDIAVEEIFGAEWGIPNGLHKEIRNFCLAAYEDCQ